MKSPYKFKLCDDCKQPIIEVHTVAGERIVVNQQPAQENNELQKKGRKLPAKAGG